MKRIAVIMGGLVFDSQNRILRGIYDALSGHETDIYIFTTHVLMASVDHKIVRGAHHIHHLPDFEAFDGVILTPNTITDEDARDWLFAEIQRTGIPAVCIDYEQENIPCITTDNYFGLYELVEHLVRDHGKRRIYYLSGPFANRDSQLRLSAFRDVMDKYEIPVEESQIFEGDFAAESGRRAWDFWDKNLESLPDAFVCANDTMAQSLLVELWGRNIRVPQDVLVTGVDNSRTAMECEPRITSIDRGYYEMGVKACWMLEELRQGKDIRHECIQQKAIVVYGESCGCSREMLEDEEIREMRRRQMVDSFYDREIATAVIGMQSAISGCIDFGGILEVLRRFVHWTDTQYFYLCMNDLELVFPREEALDKNAEAYEGLARGYTEYMTVPLAYEDGVYTSYGSYRAREVLPEEALHGRKGVHYVVIPLHYQDESFGYCVFGNSNFPIDRDLCYNWMMAISAAIQNVRKTMLLTETVHRLNEMWIYDPMTNVYNRAGFFKYAQGILEEAREQGNQIYLLFLDLDNLKKVNDTYGHEAGDAYIMALAETLKRFTTGRELALRYGGDEFVIMGQVVGDSREKELMAQVEAEMAVRCGKLNYEVPMGVSIGCHSFDPRGDVRLEQMLDQADQKMYRQKKAKKKRQRLKEKPSTEL